MHLCVAVWMYSCTDVFPEDPINSQISNVMSSSSLSPLDIGRRLGQRHVVPVLLVLVLVVGAMILNIFISGIAIRIVKFLSCGCWSPPLSEVKCPLPFDQVREDMQRSCLATYDIRENPLYRDAYWALLSRPSTVSIRPRAGSLSDTTQTQQALNGTTGQQISSNKAMARVQGKGRCVTTSTVYRKGMQGAQKPITSSNTPSPSPPSPSQEILPGVIAIPKEAMDHLLQAHPESSRPSTGQGRLFANSPSPLPIRSPPAFYDQEESPRDLARDDSAVTRSHSPAVMQGQSPLGPSSRRRSSSTPSPAPIHALRSLLPGTATEVQFLDVSTATTADFVSATEAGG